MITALIVRVAEIIRLRVPGADDWLAKQVATAVEQLRELELDKPPGVAEAISWATALRVLGLDDLTEATALPTLGAVLKYDEDRETALAAGLGSLLAE